MPNSFRYLWMPLRRSIDGEYMVDVKGISPCLDYPRNLLGQFGFNSSEDFGIDSEDFVILGYQIDGVAGKPVLPLS